MQQDLLLPGVEDASIQQEIGLGQFVSIAVKTTRTVDGATRAASNTPPTPLPKDVAEDDIVEMEFENEGRVWTHWTTVEELRKTAQSKSDRDGKLLVPRTWQTQDDARGIGAIALKTLKIFGIDTADRFAEKGAHILASKIAEKFESEIERQGHSFGLYRYDTPDRIAKENQLTSAQDVAKLDSNTPYLIFLHGTASSGVGSFGKLANRDEWSRLKTKYNGRILALEHRTFSVSPIQNALDLAELLPQDARLHLVSHSRGGLVGDLICLAQAREGRKNFEVLTQAFGTADSGNIELQAVWEKQRDDLKKLWDILLEKNIKVERFVRVACPAQGTTLASKRMDYLASGLLNAVGRIPIIDANPVVDMGYEWLKSLLLTLVKKKADPRELPGIEAMRPDSPLVTFLNHTELTTEADLGVIAGDIEVGDLKLSIPALVGNAFFWAQNDLVVNTRSMSQGIRRTKAYRFFDQGTTVCHFNYFFNDTTRAKLAEWLLREDGERVEKYDVLARSIAPDKAVSTEVHWLEEEEQPAPPYKFKVSVLHGDLRHAAHPVAVGHYDGDPIISAEKWIDTLLEKSLSHRHEMRLYPGPLGTSEVVLAPPDARLKGAIVIGLGNVGEINAETLRWGISSALIRYALAILEQATVGNTELDGQQEPIAIAFSSLLIGTYGGQSLHVKDAVNAIVQGALQANEMLRERKLDNKVWIKGVQLVELYEDMAIEALRTLHQLAEEPPLEFAKKVKIQVTPALLESRDGGRYQRPINDYDAYWWRRIQITGTKKPTRATAEGLPLLNSQPELRNAELQYLDTLLADVAQSQQKREWAASYLHRLIFQGQQIEDKDEGGLEFLVLTDRARAEGSIQAMEQHKVEWLVKLAQRDTYFDKNLAVLLFELLVPNDLKEQAQSVVLVVDRAAAHYPWELITERSQLDKPLVTRIGLLRQFKTTDGRPSPQPSRGQHALVIGDPARTGFVELTGAQREAAAVGRKLKLARYDVRSVIKQGSEIILKELFAREYKILHIAAHGVFNAEDPGQSGIVLEDGQLLTTKEITNLRTVPDLVFINCCHLGEMEQQTSVSNEFPHRLAASIAEELIRMGVRAVVAAGWAVDDAAATTFAEVFYERMLNGESFGEAVLQARQTTYAKHPGTNTWGAYQCYGTPSFRLRTWASNSGGPRKNHSRREYRDELRSIVQEVDMGRPGRNRELRERLWSMHDLIKEKKLEKSLLDGEMLTEFGDAWHALGNFAEAITFYRAAISKEDAKISLKAVEKLANFECRYAEKLWLQQQAPNGKNSTNSRYSPAELLQAAKARLDWLAALNQEGLTAERLGLLGRYHKAKAVLVRKERLKHLRMARDHYEQGYKKNSHKTYQLANLIACKFLLMEHHGIAPLLETYKKTAKEESEQGNDFWAKIAMPDFLLLQCLINENLAREQKKLLVSYQKAFARGPKLSEIDSVLSQIDFLAAMTEGKNTPGKDAEKSALQSLRTQLAQFANLPT